MESEVTNEKPDRIPFNILVYNGKCDKKIRNC